MLENGKAKGRKISSLRLLMNLKPKKRGNKIKRNQQTVFNALAYFDLVQAENENSNNKNIECTQHTQGVTIATVCG